MFSRIDFATGKVAMPDKMNKESKSVEIAFVNDYFDKFIGLKSFTYKELNVSNTLCVMEFTSTEQIDYVIDRLKDIKNILMYIKNN